MPKYYFVNILSNTQNTRTHTMNKLEYSRRNGTQKIRITSECWFYWRSNYNSVYLIFFFKICSSHLHSCRTIFPKMQTIKIFVFLIFSPFVGKLPLKNLQIKSKVYENFRDYRNAWFSVFFGKSCGNLEYDRIWWK